MNNAAMNMGVQISLQDPTLNFGGSICRSRIAEPKGNSVFNVGRNCQTVFPSICTILLVPPAVQKGSNFSAASPAFVIFWVLFLCLVFWLIPYLPYPML